MASVFLGAFENCHGLKPVAIDRLKRIMKKICVCLSVALLLCLLTLGCYAQSPPPGLVMYKTFGGAIFEYTKDTTTFTVSPKQVLQIMKDDAAAYQEFKKARVNYSVAGTMGFIGGSLIIFPVVTAIAGGDPEWGFAAGGVAFLAASIPLNKAFKRHAEGAIDTYNKNHTTFRPHTEYFFSGLGLKVLIKF